MKNYLILIVSSLFMNTSCNPTCNPKEEVNIKEILINFFPSSGGNAIYTIALKNGKVTIKNNEPLNKDTIEVYTKNISDKELQELERLIQLVNKRSILDTDTILDSWRIELIINGDRYYNESGVRIETLPTDIKDLIIFFTKESSVKIDLYGFS